MKGRTTNLGYILVTTPKDHYSKKTLIKNQYIREHRLVWEIAHNCCLLPWVDVHHKNGIIIDNRIENLQPLIHGDHSRITNKKDLSKRICKICSSKTTHFCKAKSGFMWIRYEDGHICKLCYEKQRQSRIRQAKKRGEMT